MLPKLVASVLFFSYSLPVCVAYQYLNEPEKAAMERAFSIIVPSPESSPELTGYCGLASAWIAFEDTATKFASGNRKGKHGAQRNITRPFFRHAVASCFVFCAQVVIPLHIELSIVDQNTFALINRLFFVAAVNHDMVFYKNSRVK